MEDGNFTRGSEIITAEGSIVFLGNLSRTMREGIKSAEAYFKGNLGWSQDVIAVDVNIDDPGMSRPCTTPPTHVIPSRWPLHYPCVSIFNMA